MKSTFISYSAETTYKVKHVAARGLTTLRQRLRAKDMQPKDTIKTAFLQIAGNRHIPLDKLSYWMKFANWCAEHGSHQFGGEYADRYPMYDRIVSSLSLADAPVNFLEFGVYEGESIRWWSDHLKNRDSTFVGFDTFTGLPQEWNEEASSRHFNVHGCLPQIQDHRVTFEVGLFQKTLPQFLRGFQRVGRIILHMDADLYSSTLFALIYCGPLLQAGDLILFDEFACPSHEFRAFMDFISVFEFPYRVVERAQGFNKLFLQLV